MKRWLRALGWLSLLYALIWGTAAYSGPDRNYHPICESEQLANCVPQADYVQHRDDCTGTGRARCFGVGNDGWDTWRMDSKKNGGGMTPQPFEYATLEYLSDQPGDATRWDERQIDAIVARLDTLVAERTPLMVVILAHGWHHNAFENIDPASPDSIQANGDRPYNQNLNLLAFKHILAKTNYELDVNKDERKVFGIYIGWNGGSESNYLNAARIGQGADRIGRSPDFAEDMARINTAINKGSQLVTPVLAIGHSFGGRLLSRYMLKMVADGQALVQPFGPRGLVTTINPAIGADAFDDFMQREYPSAAAAPYWVNITSVDDYATGVVLPVGASLGRAVGVGIGITDKVFARSGYHAIGHFPRYRTHLIETPYVAASESCGVDQDCFAYKGCQIAKIQGRIDIQPYFKGLPDEMPRKTGWYRLRREQSGHMVPLFYERGTACDSRYYFIELNKVPGTEGHLGSPNWMWNIYADRIAIDSSSGSDPGDDCTSDGSDQTTKERKKMCGLAASVAVHNAFVQTRFVRMFLEIIMDKH